jgi:hypothetical protein
MKEALSSSETSVLTTATWRNVSEDAILHSHRRENLKSYNDQTNLDVPNTTLRHGFHFYHRNHGTFAIKSYAHDKGRTLVRAEYGYLKNSPNKK